MDNSCIFCKIIAKEIPSKMEYEDEFCVIFHDIHPRAKIHLLAVPKKHLSTMNDMEKNDEAMMGRVMKAATDIAKKMDLKSYKLMISVGKEAGQEVFHVHMHIMSPT